MQWAADYGITAVTIMNRMHVGMPVDRAITKPVRVKPGDQLPDINRPKHVASFLTFKGRTMTLRAWADELGLRPRPCAAGTWLADRRHPHDAEATPGVMELCRLRRGRRG